MKTSKRGIDIIKHFEGFCALPYRDSAGVLTIGWGHTRGAGEHEPPISIELAEALLAEDVADAETHVLRMIKPYTPTQQQFDALVSFVFNFGGGPRVETSRLFSALRLGKPRMAAREFLHWVHVTRNGEKRVVPGLITRRQAERDLFLEGTPA